MSLINKLLADLEKRQAYLDGEQHLMLDGLYSAYDVELDKKRKNSAFILILSGLITLLFAVSVYSLITSTDEKINHIQLVDIEDTEKEEQIAEKIEIEEKVASVAASTREPVKMEKIEFLQLESELSFQETAPEPAPFANTINRIESIQFLRNDKGVDLVMETSAEIDYLLYGLEEPSRTVIEIDNAEIGFAIEQVEPTEPIVSIRYSMNSNNKVKLVFESDEELNIRKSSTSKLDDRYNLVVSIDHAWNENNFNQIENISIQNDIGIENINFENTLNDEDIVLKGELIKRPSIQRDSAYADKLFKQAYREYKNSNISESLKLLNLALDNDGSHTNARSTLALILFEQNHSELAISVLNEGLIEYPENSKWSKMLARFLLKQGKVIEAENVLSKKRPPISSNADYYAMHAAILQKLNDHDNSARIYRDLLQINPLKAVWWMGLGISLESLKRYDDALYAYQKAINSPALTGESKTFVSERLVMLNKMINDESS